MKITEILIEAKETYDLRHEPSDMAFWGDKNSEYINPADGFHFSYSEGILAVNSTSNLFYDAAVKYGKSERKDGYGIIVNFPDEKTKKAINSKLYNAFGGIVSFSDKTITISKEYDMKGKQRSRSVERSKSIKQAFMELKRFGVTGDFKIKGLMDFNGTINDFMQLNDQVDDWANNKNIIFYHGTTLERAEQILSKGMIPGNEPAAYVDLIPGYSDKNVYLTTSPNTAMFYAKRAVSKEGGTWAILKITGIDQNRLTADDGLVWRGDGFDPSKIINPKNSLKHGVVGYKGTIVPNKISLFKKGKAS